MAVKDGKRVEQHFASPLRNETIQNERKQIYMYRNERNKTNRINHQRNNATNKTTQRTQESERKKKQQRNYRTNDAKQPTDSILHVYMRL